MTLVQNPKLFCHFCKLVYAVKIIPIEFHPQVGTTTLVDNSSSILWKWNHRFHALWVATSVIQLQVTSNKTTMEGILAAAGVALQIASLILIHEERRKSVETAKLCNALFHFENIYPSGRKHPRTLNEIGSMILLHCMLLSPTVLPVGYVYGLHLMNPCKVSLVGSWLIPECNDGLSLSNTIAIVVKFTVIPRNIQGIILINHWLWLTTVCSGTFIVSVVNTLSVSNIQQLIERLSLLA